MNDEDGDFFDKIDRLIASVDESVKGEVEVNQVYAHYQHEHPEFHHPDGGQAFYLKEPLFVKSRTYMQTLADHLIGKDGKSHTRDGMIAVVEDLSMEVYHRAPWEFGDLRASGHPKVTVDGYDVVYDRPPLVGRLSEEDLKAKKHLQYLFDPNRYSYERGAWRKK